MTNIESLRDCASLDGERLQALWDEIDRLSRPAHEREPPHCSTCACGAHEPARRQLDTVAGLEMHAILHPHHLDTSPDLLPCPFCGHEGAFTDGHKRGVSDNYTVAAACSNTSCGVRTPEHYKDRASAAVAWNRRALNRT